MCTVLARPGQRVLLVEPDPAWARFLRHVLNLNGARCVRVGSAVEALGLDGEPADLLICAERLPDGSAYGLRLAMAPPPRHAILLCTRNAPGLADTAHHAGYARAYIKDHWRLWPALRTDAKAA